MKLLFRMLLVLYLLILLWVVLFKLSFDLLGVLLHYQARSITLIPFTGGTSEMVSNVIVFIPLGLFLSINFKQVKFWQKLTLIFTLSLTVEIVQFIFAIGRTDITDIITNTLGGLIGLGLYSICSKFVDNKKLDLFIAIVSIVLLSILLVLRIFFLRVRY